jgi:hypothetical protein
MAQRGLSSEYQFEHNLRDQVLNACEGIRECSYALLNPSPTFKGVCSALRAAVKTAVNLQSAEVLFQSAPYGEPDQN